MDQPDAPASEPPEHDQNVGALLGWDQSEALEARDRQHSGPGGEPDCPMCGTGMVRQVERHRAPRSDESPFRVRLTCPAPDCGRWTVYDW